MDFEPDTTYLRLRHTLEDGAALSAEVMQLSTAQLSSVVGTESNITLRKRFLQSAGEVATPAALLALTQAAAHAFTRPLSPPLDSLLRKLAREAAELPETIRPQADRSFRDLFKQIVDTWSVGSLDTSASTFETLFEEQRSEMSPAGSAAPEADRVVQFAFESGALGNVVWNAIAQMGDSGGVRRLLDMLKHAPPGSRAADAVAQQFANPTRLTMLLQEDPVDFGAIDALVARMGEGAATALLDGIAEAKSRETRRSLLERIVGLGPNVCGLVTERLRKDERWFVQRNMLTILRELKCPIAQLPLDKFLGHTDPRVRREAMQLQFSDPLQRDRALITALRETDSQIVKVALQACRGGLPEAAVPILAKRVIENDFPPEFRPAALQLIGRSNSILALEALLRFAMGGTTLLGKPKLASKSPEMLISLSALARAWPNDRRAAPLLAAARDSKDRAVASAATPARVATSEGKDAFDAIG